MLLGGIKIGLKLKTLMDTNQVLFTDNTIHPLLIVCALVSFDKFHQKRETVHVLFLSSDAHQIRHMRTRVSDGTSRALLILLKDRVRLTISQIGFMIRISNGFYDFHVIFSRHHLNIIGMML